jgi:hypothetical protein
MTVLFMMLFGRWGQSEMNWYGNEYLREKIKKREMNFIPITILIDIFLYNYFL